MGIMDPATLITQHYQDTLQREYQLLSAALPGRSVDADLAKDILDVQRLVRLAKHAGSVPISYTEYSALLDQRYPFWERSYEEPSPAQRAIDVTTINLFQKLLSGEGETYEDLVRNCFPTRWEFDRALAPLRLAEEKAWLEYVHPEADAEHYLNAKQCMDVVRNEFRDNIYDLKFTPLPATKVSLGLHPFTFPSPA